MTTMIDEILERLDKARIKAIADRDYEEADAIQREMKYLERLKEPTEGMVEAMECDYAAEKFVEAMQAAEEDL